MPAPPPPPPGASAASRGRRALPGSASPRLRPPSGARPRSDRPAAPAALQAPRAAVALLLAALLGAAPAHAVSPGALPPSDPPADPGPPAPLVEAARAYLGRPYAFGGRDRNLDCMGLVFRAWSDAGHGSWRSLSVNPTELVARASLGDPVPGVSPAWSTALDPAALAPGDVLFFLGRAENPLEPALATLAGVELWVWHMGLYAGGPDHTFVVGDHFAGRVVEEPLPAYLAAHREYVAVFAVRPR